MAHDVKRIARGDTAKVNSYIGPAGELVMDTQAKELAMQDGETRGGIRLRAYSNATTTVDGLMSKEDKLSLLNLVASASVNVRDYGAKGDGVTDDTAAFEAAIADSKGYGVYVPPGIYNISHAVEGFFWSDENVVIPYIRVWCKHYYNFTPKDFVVGAPSSIGGDYPRLTGYEPQQWERAQQCGCCDIFDKVLYFPCESSTTRESCINVVKWSEVESERILLKSSAWEYGKIGHQCLNIYRPTRDTTPTFIMAISRYVNSTTPDNSRTFTVGFFSFNYRVDNSPTLKNTAVLFNSSEVNALFLDNTTLMNVSCSADGAVMVAVAYSASTGLRTCKVWDLHAIMMGKISYYDLATSYKYKWTEPAIDKGFGGQGVWTDGRYVYLMSGAGNEASYSSSLRVAVLKVFTLSGDFLGLYSINTAYAEREHFSGFRSEAEFEGIFLVPWYDKLTPILYTSFRKYTLNTTTEDYKRYNRYALIDSARNSGAIVQRDVKLTGEVHAVFPTALGTAAQDVHEQRILSYAPSGTGDVNLCLGCEAGTFICGGEVNSKVRAAFYNAVNDKKDVIAERVALYSDGSIIIHGGVADTDDLLEESGTLNGLRVNGGNNVFVVGSGPLLLMSHNGVTKGTGASTSGRIAFTCSSTSGTQTQHLFDIQHIIFSDKSHGARLRLYDNISRPNTDNNVIMLDLHQKADASYIIEVGANCVPAATNVYDLGSDGVRWHSGYFSTPAQVVSDAREKQQITNLEAAEKRAAIKCKNLIKKFKFNYAVAEKGDDARFHVGVTAQEIKAAFESENLVAEDYGIICHGSWDDEYEERVIREDENGNILETARVLVRPAGDEYSIRYEELLCFIIAAM